METRFGCRLYLLNILHCDKYEMPMSSHPWPCLQRYRYNDGDHRIDDDDDINDDGEDDNIEEIPYCSSISSLRNPFATPGRLQNKSQ